METLYITAGPLLSLIVYFTYNYFDTWVGLLPPCVYFPPSTGYLSDSTEALKNKIQEAFSHEGLDGAINYPQDVQ